MTATEPALIAAICALAGAVVHLWRLQVRFRDGQQAYLEKTIRELQTRLHRIEQDNESLENKVALLERENTRLLTQFVTLSAKQDAG